MRDPCDSYIWCLDYISGSMIVRLHFSFYKLLFLIEVTLLYIVVCISEVPDSRL